MGLKKAESQVKTMLEDTILALCRNTLSYRTGISIEGIIGVTLDNEEIFLVNINQSFKSPLSQLADDGLQQQQKRHAESDDATSDSGGDRSEHEDADDGGERKEKTKRKRKRARKKSWDIGISSSTAEQSSYFHNDKENGCTVNAAEDQDIEMNNVSEKDAEDKGYQSVDVKQEIDDFRNKDQERRTVKEEEFLHLGTQFANLYNSFNIVELPNLGQHGYPIGPLPAGASSSVTSPTPLSMSQNIPPAPGPSARSPSVAKKSTGSPRRAPPGSPASRSGSPENGSPENGSPNNGSPENGSPENGSPENGSSENGSPENGSPENGSPENGSPENGSPENGSPENGSPENGSPEKATCQLCGRVCISRSKLVIHMRVHTGEKPFICFICGRGCMQKSDLKKHIRTVHKMFMQHGVMQHGVMQHGVMQHGVMQHGIMQHGIMQHGIMQHGVMQHGVAEHS